MPKDTNHLQHLKALWTPAFIHHIASKYPAQPGQEVVAKLHQQKTIRGMNKEELALFYTPQALAQIPIRKGSLSPQEIYEMHFLFLWNDFHKETLLHFFKLTPQQIHSLRGLYKPQTNPEGILRMKTFLEEIKSCVDFKSLSLDRLLSLKQQRFANTLINCEVHQYIEILDLELAWVLELCRSNKITPAEEARRCAGIHALRKDPQNAQVQLEVWLSACADNNCYQSYHPPLICPDSRQLPVDKFTPQGREQIEYLASIFGAKPLVSPSDQKMKDLYTPYMQMDIHNILRSDKLPSCRSSRVGPLDPD